MYQVFCINSYKLLNKTEPRETTKKQTCYIIQHAGVCVYKLYIHKNRKTKRMKLFSTTLRKRAVFMLSNIIIQLLHTTALAPAGPARAFVPCPAAVKTKPASFCTRIKQGKPLFLDKTPLLKYNPYLWDCVLFTCKICCIILAFVQFRSSHFRNYLNTIESFRNQNQAKHSI